MRRERERDIETKAVKLLREQGAKVAKLNLLGQRGWPDRLAVAPNGAHCWLEFKKPGEDLTALQAELKRDFARRGIVVHTVRSVVEAIVAYNQEKQRWQLVRDTFAMAEEAWLEDRRCSSGPTKRKPRATSSRTRTPGS